MGELVTYPYRYIQRENRFRLLNELDWFMDALLAAGYPRWLLLEAFIFHAFYCLYREYGPYMPQMIIEAQQQRALSWCAQDSQVRMFNAHYPQEQPVNGETWDRYWQENPQWWRRNELNPMHGL